MSKAEKDIKYDWIPAPSTLKEEKGEVTVYVGGERNNEPDSTVAEDIAQQILNTTDHNHINKNIMSDYSLEKVLHAKSFEHSNQSQDELREGSIRLSSANFKVISPPYDPDCFQKFLDVSEVHASCVETKVRDSTGRDYQIHSVHPVSETGLDPDIKGRTVSPEEFAEDCSKIEEFIKNCNDSETFNQVCHKVAMDREAIGWGAFEVIRQADGRIARLQHIPATKLRVLKGFKGFVEIVSTEDTYTSETQYRFYQNFGEKVGRYVDDIFDLSATPNKVFRAYDPQLDGDLVLEDGGLTFNFLSKGDGQPLKEGSFQEKFMNSANEVLFMPRTHASTVYYGYSCIVPAIGAIIANMHIRDYLLQFFEHNCIPRYAVIIKGASVDDEFMELIEDYFENKVKGSAHKTIILALTGFGNRTITVEFQKLDSGNKEADFLQTKKSNDGVIVASHGMHDSLIGISQPSTLGSGNGLSHAEQYKDRILIPLQKYWEDKLNTLFSIGLGVKYAKIKYDPKDIRDKEGVSRALVQLVQAGIISINEARSELGYENTEGGSIPFSRVREGSIVKVEDIPQMESNIEEVPTVGDSSNIETNQTPKKEENSTKEEE